MHSLKGGGKNETAKTLSLVVATLFCAASFSMAAGWDSCKGCHKEGNKPAPSKETLLKKFKTADALIKAAKGIEKPNDGIVSKKTIN